MSETRGTDGGEDRKSDSVSVAQSEEGSRKLEKLVGLEGALLQSMALVL